MDGVGKKRGNISFTQPCVFSPPIVHRIPLSIHLQEISLSSKNLLVVMYLYALVNKSDFYDILLVLR